MDRLVDLLGGRLVILTNTGDQSVPLAWLRYRDAMLIGERLQLRIGPAAW